MTREMVRLHNALTNAYKECLRQAPASVFRIHHQTLYAELRDSIAAIGGISSQEVQDHFEMLVATEGED